MRGVAVLAHPRPMCPSRSEAAILRLPGFRFGHRFGEKTAEARLIVERRKERGPLFGVELETRFVRFLLLEFLLERQLRDHVELHGVAEEECRKRHVLVDRCAGISLSHQGRTKAVENARGDLGEAKRAKLRNQVAVDAVAVIARGLLFDARFDRGEVVSDELAERRGLGRRAAESFGGPAPERGPEPYRLVIRCGTHRCAFPDPASRAGHVH